MSLWYLLVYINCSIVEVSEARSQSNAVDAYMLNAL